MKQLSEMYPAMLGAGGAQYTWHDRPAFTTMTSIISSFIVLGDESGLLRCMKLILDRHPSVVNVSSNSRTPFLKRGALAAPCGEHYATRLAHGKRR